MIEARSYLPCIGALIRNLSSVNTIDLCTKICLSLFLSFALHPVTASAEACLVPNITGTTDGYIAIAPAAPVAGHVFTISAGGSRLDPETIAVDVTGNVVTVYISSVFDELGAPPQPLCKSISAGPLSGGTYTANLVVTAINRPGDPPEVYGSGTFVVSESAGSDIASVPAARGYALLIMGALIAASAFAHFCRAR